MAAIEINKGVCPFDVESGILKWCLNVVGRNLIHQLEDQMAC